MEQTINFMGRINPKYTQKIVEEAQMSGNVVMMLDKDGQPQGAYIKVDKIDMEKFGKSNDSLK
jgi:uncharacterized protein YhfF